MKEAQSFKTTAISVECPYCISKALAKAVLSRQTGVTLCACSCGRPVTGRKIYAGNACRKRVFDRRLAGVKYA